MTTAPISASLVERRFLDAIKHHLAGWETKIRQDFSLGNYERELTKLQNDPVYSRFALDCPEYVLVRLIGRMSISVGRRLGEIYDKLPRFVASARFNVTPNQVAEKFGGLELDIGLRLIQLSEEDGAHIQTVLSRFGSTASGVDGVGIEIRYNFNPNDSARLRKDVAMVEHLQADNLLPVYLVYSAISPRYDAISRLTRAGWNFLQGEEASKFTTELFTVNFLSLMDKPEVREEIHEQVKGIMRSIFNSAAYAAMAKVTS